MQLSIVYISYRHGGIDVLADSLSRQTFKDYELIIIDDYSSDRRNKIRTHLEEREIPVTYIGPSKPKCFPDIAYNVSNAINTGFLLSTKEVVILLQDYIWLLPDCLEKFAKQHNLFTQNYCVVLPGYMWESPRSRKRRSAISIWHQEWRGRPEANDCQLASVWIPEAWEFSCIAFPWSLIVAMNGYPEYLDCDASHRLPPLVKWLEKAGGKPYVDKDNFIHMINHREWHPKEIWHQAKRAPKGSTEYIERENCFDLKTHIRGRAYWLESETKDIVKKSTNEVFDKPEYWCGELGYRPGPDGVGYKDFEINGVKVEYILHKFRQKVEGGIHVG